MQLNIFADKGDLYRAVRALYLSDHGLPLGKIGLGAVDAELAAYDRGKALVLQKQRRFVQRRGRCVLDDTLGLDIAEKRDLSADIVAYRGVGSAHEDIRLDTDGQKFLYRVLRGLALELTRAGDLNDQRNVDKQHVLPALFDGDLTYGLQKRLAFDIADRAADLADENVDVLVLHGVNALLYLVGHMGYYLHRAAEVSALTLTVENIPVYTSCGDRGVSAQALVDESFIVAEVEVGLRAVVGDEDLAVLIRTHSARINVEIGVEFLVFHTQSALLQKSAERGRAYSLAQPRHDSACYEYILHHHLLSLIKILSYFICSQTENNIS